MHPSPDKIELSFLNGKTLLQVCIGKNEVVLNFEDSDFDKASITLEGNNIGILYPNAEEETIFSMDPKSVAASAISEFLGVVVTDSIYKNGTLTLKLSKKGSLIFYNDQKDYVSYSICYGDHSILV